MYIISNNLAIDKKFSLPCIKKNIKKTGIQPNLNLKNSNRFTSTHGDTNQIILMLGNQTCSQSNFEYIPLKILESHLSYGMSSVLFKLFREKNGLTYDVGVFNPSRQQNAPFLIYLSVSNKNALTAFKILNELWENLVSNLIDNKELDLAKLKLKSSLLISNQSLDEILHRRIQLIGNDLDPDFDQNSLKKIEDIKSEDILKIANKYFSEPFLSVYGNKKICSNINKIWIKNF